MMRIRQLFLSIFAGCIIFVLSSQLFFITKLTSLVPKGSIVKKSSLFTCPIQGTNWIVVTSSFHPTPAIHRFLSLNSQWILIVIGNRKTPKDWLTHLSKSSSQLVFLDMEQQATLDFRILHHLPYGSYARKNLGYLIAIACGAQIIFECDDETILETDNIQILPKIVQPKDAPWIAFHRQRSPFINIYGSFGHPEIWPRGFPVEELRNVTEDGWHSVRRNENKETPVYIQQYLADDVDALYRLAHPLSIGRIELDPNQSPIILQPFTFSPYNTQNTITHYEAFWGLYLPVTTTFRVCDIWRSFWVQRLLWDIGGCLIFRTGTVQQERNSHSYMDDEDQLYHRSGSFVRFLASWSSSLPSLADRISQLARDITRAGFWQSYEIEIIDAWLADLRSVGYSFPAIVTSSPAKSSILQKRTAMCVTGPIEGIDEGWTSAQIEIRKRLEGDVDTFLFLSSTQSNGLVPFATTRFKQARAYNQSTMMILYEDRVLNPQIPPNCPVHFEPGISSNILHPHFQQLWALAECFDMVKDYEQKMHIHYQFMIRARIDTRFRSLPATFEPINSSTILILDDDFNDRFALGSMHLMKIYMRRWYDISRCYDGNLHLKSFLQSTLKRYDIAIQFDKNMSY